MTGPGGWREKRKTRAELEVLWSAVGRLLESALRLLPESPRRGDDGGSLEECRVYLDHNEMELALDELRMLGDANDAPAAYWETLAEAARLMELDARVPSSRRLVILGATGAVGRHVLAEALRSPAFAAVTTLGRRKADVADGEAPPGKLAQHVVDFEAPASYRALVAGHTAAICTLGVGQPSKSTREEVWKVEIDYVMAFAAACRDAGVRHFSLMTSVGSDARSTSYYLRLKGTQEDRVKALGFERTSLFRPSLLITQENRYGAGQGMFLAVWPKLHWLLAGPLRRYRGVRVEDLGRAITMNAARHAPAGVEVYEWDDFQRILEKS